MQGRTQKQCVLLSYPAKNNVFAPNNISVHLSDAIIKQVGSTPFLENVELSVLKFGSSS